MTKPLIPALLAILLLGGAGTLSAEPGLVQISEDPWPPYVYGTESVPATHGLAVDIAKAVFARLGFEIEVRLYPWKRCLVQMYLGERDALLLVRHKSEREAFLVYPESLLTETLVLYSRSDVPIEWNDHTDLRGLILARTAGYYYGDEFEKGVEENDLVFELAPTPQLGFLMLEHGRVDAFISNSTVAREFFRTNPELAGHFHAAAKPVYQGPIYLAFSRKSPARHLVPEFNRIVRQMKETGEIQAIVDAFFQKPPPAP